jgi:hypothetical protein
VWLADGRLFNLEMVTQGYAFEYIYDQPYAYQAQLRQAQRDAREQGRGLWAPGACNGEHHPAEGPPAAAATTEPSTIAPAQPTATVAPADGVTITRAPGTVRRGARATVAAHTSLARSARSSCATRAGQAGRRG